MNFNDTQLLNSHSYLEQKMNLKGDNDTSPIYEKELFLIPKFTVVGFPMENAQKTSYYYLELEVFEAYCYDLDTKNEYDGLLNDVTFQYDLNYSNIERASGQILISKSIKWVVLRKLFLELLENNKMPPYTDVAYFHMWMKVYKIILPAAAIKKDSVNILHYSFNGKTPANLKMIRHINNKHNYGALSFYFNSNPCYQLQIKPSMFMQTNFNLEIKNPIILTTDFKDNLYCCFSDTVIKNKTIGGKSKLDEVFTFSGNNINTSSIIPIKITHYLLSYFPVINYWYDDKEEILNKILAFNNNFSLQQSTNLNIDEAENHQFYQNNKIPAFLWRDNKIKDNFDEYYLIFTSNTYNNITNKITLNDEIAKNKFDLPWFKSFYFKINIPFKFQTFFNYNINLKFIEASDEPIIGNSYNSISIRKLTNKNIEDWATTTTFSLSYDEIVKFYSSNFTFIDYKYLNSQVEK